MTNSNMTNEIETLLREITDGVRSDIFKSYEALNLLHIIVANASDINSSGFGILFGRLQLMLQEQIILLVTKIFEKHDDNHSLKSIPVIVKLI